MEELSKLSKAQIFNSCLSLGCCHRCSLRFLGARNYSKLTTIDESEFNEFLVGFLRESNDCNENLELNRNNKRVASELCSSCFGLLQPTPKSTTISQILQAIEQKGIQFEDFHLSVSLPATLALRSAIIASKINKLLTADKTPKEIFTVKDIWKRILSKRICEKFSAKICGTSSLQIIVTVTHKNESNECSQIFQEYSTLFANQCPAFKSGVKIKQEKVFNHTSIAKAIDALPAETLSELEVLPTNNDCDIENVECVFNSLYVVGRYNKYDRNLSQTPWIIDGQKKMETSVQDILIEKIQHFIPCQKMKFSACGREDVDVRMLGRGRPFVIEIIEPEFVGVTEDIIMKIEETINSSGTSVAVRDLQLSTKEEVNYNLKQGETNKMKEYAALCCFDRPLTDDDLKKIGEIKELEINQKTPVRVLHRRSLVTRKRTIYKASATREDERTATVVLLTEAGTYVKEFVHSDFGRTYPSLATIVGNCKTDIIELDVLDIHFEWPPKK